MIIEFSNLLTMSYEINTFTKFDHLLNYKIISSPVPILLDYRPLKWKKYKVESASLVIETKNNFDMKSNDPRSLCIIFPFLCLFFSTNVQNTLHPPTCVPWYQYITALFVL
jgi:hypothetical protein